MKVAGSAVAGARDAMEEVALLFAASAERQAKVLLEVRRTEASLHAARQATATARAHLQEAEGALGRHDAELGEAQEASPGPFTRDASRNQTVAVGGLVLGGVLTLVVPPVGLVLVLGAILWLLFCNQKKTAEAQAKASRIAQMHYLREPLARAFDAARGACEHAQRTQAELEQYRETLKPQKAVKAVGRAYLPFMPLELAGYSVLVDGTGSTATTTLSLPDLAANGEALSRIRATVDAAKNAPILLRPTGDAPTTPERIHGEENDLGEAIDTFGEVLESVPVVAADVPLVPATHALVKTLLTTPKTKATTGAVVRGSSTATKAALAKVKRYTDNMRGAGKNIEQTLRSLRDDLRTVLVRYGELRSAAVEEAHRNLTEVLARSDLAHVTYYCPRCNRVPQYMFQKLGVDLETAHEASPYDLVQALQENDEARERLVADEGLAGDLANVWQAIQEVDANLRHQQDQMTANANAMQADLRSAQIFETRVRALESQKRQLVGQFQALLRKIVTGNPRPVLELSRQARLTLDPETGEWDCALCELHIDDQEVARMGRLLKIKDELLMPMWNALWTEKDDFRKKELFRTNEQIQRLVEKEVSALRDVSEQYRADMRPVRENLMLATTEALAARDQLEAAVQSLSALGVISEQRATETVGRLGKMTGGDLDKLKKRAETKETMLNMEPQAQMNRRTMAIDPISQLMSPDQLFKERAREAERPMLATREEGGS